MLNSLPDSSVRARIPFGPFRGMQLCQVPDTELHFLIKRAENQYYRDAAFDEWRYRCKLGLVGENP